MKCAHGATPRAAVAPRRRVVPQRSRGPSRSCAAWREVDSDAVLGRIVSSASRSPGTVPTTIPFRQAARCDRPAGRCGARSPADWREPRVEQNRQPPIAVAVGQVNRRPGFLSAGRRFQSGFVSHLAVISRASPQGYMSGVKSVFVYRSVRLYGDRSRFRRSRRVSRHCITTVRNSTGGWSRAMPGHQFSRVWNVHDCPSSLREIRRMKDAAFG